MPDDDASVPRAPAVPQNLAPPLVLEDYIPVPKPITFTSPDICAFCHIEVAKSQRCARCKNISYCSKECQTTDWSAHKTVCKAYAKTDAQQAPGSSVGRVNRRAMLFADGKVTFTWLEYELDSRPINLMEHFPCIPLSFGQDLKAVGFHSRYLPYWIQLWYDSKPDSIHSSLSTVRSRSFNKKPLAGFRGPVVAIAFHPELGLTAPALDIDTTALGPIMKYAELRRDYKWPIFIEQPQERYTEEQLRELFKKKNGNPIAMM